jgi:hypothetical protein
LLLLADKFDPANGPITVTLEKIGLVLGLLAEPVASLSDSKALDPETSAISFTRCAKANCTLPE